MDKNRILLKVNRFEQKPNECALAACASLANFYDPEIDYSKVRKMLHYSDRNSGLFTPTIGKLLNILGFKSVRIISADIECFDLTWKQRSQSWILKRIKKMRDYYKRSSNIHDSYAEVANEYIDFLEMPNCTNDLIVDWDFTKWIRYYLRRNRPVGASLNWTSFFRFPKYNSSKRKDDIKGRTEEHEVVIRGCDKYGVFVVDSHSECYKGRLAKYQSGYYKIVWSDFLMNVGGNDLLVIR